MGRRRRILGLISAGLAVTVLAVTVLAAGAVVGGAALTASPAVAASRAQTGRLTARLVLAGSVVRGGSLLHGSLVLENPSSTARVLLHGCRVDGLFGVAFRAANGYLTGPVNPLVGCPVDLPSNEIIARPGRTVYRFSVDASSTGCTGDPTELPRPYSPDWSPLCLRGRNGRRDIIPPLPAGRYAVTFVPNGHWHGPRVAPVPVVVAPAR